MKKLTVMVPCYNEEDGIGNVVRGVPKKQLQKLGYKVDILVIDNNSKDKTSQVAKKAGARVVFEKTPGKGNAVQRGFKSIDKDTDIVVMLDGDDTYKSSEMLRVVEPIDSKFCDVVIGTRLGGKIAKGSMSKFNYMGNKIFTQLVRAAYNCQITDVLTGYWAWNKKAWKKLAKHLESDEFSIEMEMMTKLARMKFSIFSVPITYEDRLGESSLRPIRDGLQILQMWFKNLFWRPNTAR